MRELAFIIEKIETIGEYFKFTLKGYSDIFEYDLYFQIKTGLPSGSADTGEFLFHENCMFFERKSVHSDNIIPALNKKFDLKTPDLKKIKKRIDVCNMFPVSGNPTKVDKTPTSLKGFMGDGSIEFYINILPKKKIFIIDVREGSEKEFIEQLCER